MQQVNLFSADFAPSRSRLDLRALIFSFLAALVVVSLIGAWRYQALSKARAQTAEIYAQGEQIMQKITQLQGDRKAQLNAAQKKPQIKQQIVLQTQLLNDLRTRAAQEKSGFSPIFDSLTKVPPKSVWLTQISIDSGMVSFQGETINAKMLPEWISTLQTTPGFQTKSFSHLVIAPVDKKPGVLAFELSEVANEPQQ